MSFYKKNNLNQSLNKFNFSPIKGVPIWLWVYAIYLLFVNFSNQTYTIIDFFDEEFSEQDSHYKVSNLIFLGTSILASLFLLINFFSRKSTLIYLLIGFSLYSAVCVLIGVTEDSGYWLSVKGLQAIPVIFISKTIGWAWLPDVFSISLDVVNNILALPLYAALLYFNKQKIENK